MPIAAEPADELLAELRSFVAGNSAHLMGRFGLLVGPLRIAWAHARATVATRALGIRPEAEAPSVSVTRNIRIPHIY